MEQEPYENRTIIREEHNIIIKMRLTKQTEMLSQGPMGQEDMFWLDQIGGRSTAKMGQEP